MNIYERQENLNLKIPKNAAIIGCGGIGSWLCINLALIGVENIIIFDPDRVEYSNLNRTLFRIRDIGKYKTTALKQLIEERRINCNIIAINKRYSNEKLENCLIFDCTDGINVPNAIKLGYDGLNYTIISNTSNAKVWGGTEQVRYTSVPSFLGTPQFLANIITNAIVCGVEIRDINGKIEEIVKKIMEAK